MKIRNENVEILKRVQDDNMITTKLGFTLIELLVVVMIIAILAAIAVPQYKIAVEKAHLTEAITLLRTTASAEKAYYLANGEYTTDWNALDIIALNGTDPQIRSNNYFYINLTVAETRHMLYVARNNSEFNHQTKRWYLGYDLNNDKLYCYVNKENQDIARKVCYTFNSTVVTCPWSKQEDCYLIN